MTKSEIAFAKRCAPYAIELKQYEIKALIEKWDEQWSTIPFTEAQQATIQSAMWERIAILNYEIECIYGCLLS